MLFTSLNFLVFFALTTVVYYWVPSPKRWILLLAASLIFYLFSIPVYALVLVFSIVSNYLLGNWISRCADKSARKLAMITGILFNLFLLAVFRYAGSFIDILSGMPLIVRTGEPVLQHIIIPLGISFYTFSNISYLVEIKRKNIQAENHLGYFACYISFFPKLIQGPIDRPQHFIPQLRKNHPFDYQEVTNGIRLMLWGFFKKLVIADHLSLMVNGVYDNKEHWHGPLLVFSTILFAFQIYMDFSGYIDIARGAARILGFRLSRNFNSPYLSTSIKEFWNRWHITLSQWLRDYLFLPVAYYVSAKMKKEAYAGIRVDKYIYAIAISVTFLLCGLWHGSGWNFIAWGGIFAIYLITGSLLEKPKKRFYKKTGFSNHKKAFNAIQVSITFMLVCFAWIFFRAPDLVTAMEIINKLPSGWNSDTMWGALSTIQGLLNQQNLSLPEGGVLLLLIPSVIGIESFFQEHANHRKFAVLPMPVRWLTYYLLVLLICYFGIAETNSFVYFQF